MGPAGADHRPVHRSRQPAGHDADPTSRGPTGSASRPQQLSGTYTVTLASSIQSPGRRRARHQPERRRRPAQRDRPAGRHDADHVQLRPTRRWRSPDAEDDHVARSPSPTTSSIQGVTLTLNITYPNDPDLEASLIAPDGDDGPAVHQRRRDRHAGQLHQHDLRRHRDAPRSRTAGRRSSARSSRSSRSSALQRHDSAAGTWTLEIIRTTRRPATTGTLNSWSLTFQKPVSATGLGEPVADQATASFRIFTIDPTNPLSSNTWTAVGPAVDRRRQRPATATRAGSAASRSTRPTRRATPSTSAAPAAASGRRPTS